MFRNLVRRIEGLALHARPPAVVEDLGGWRLRYDRGVTQRANSVWPHEARGRLSLKDRLHAVEAFYRERELQVLYQPCAPNGIRLLRIRRCTMMYQIVRGLICRTRISAHPGAPEQ